MLARRQGEEKAGERVKEGTTNPTLAGQLEGF